MVHGADVLGRDRGGSPGRGSSVLGDLRRRAAPRGRRARSARRGEASSGLMSISLIQRCSTTSWLKRTSSCSSAARSTGARPRTPFSAVKIRVCSIIRRARVRVQRRQGQRAVLEDLDQLPAGAEQQHRAELRVEAAADDQLVAVQLDHRLDGHAQEVLGAGPLAHRRLDRADRRARTASASRQVQLHAADVGLVRDRLGVQLEDDRVADARRRPRRPRPRVAATWVATVGMP